VFGESAATRNSLKNKFQFEAQQLREMTQKAEVRLVLYVMLWCPFNTPAIAVDVGGGGFHGIRSVGRGAHFNNSSFNAPPLAAPVGGVGAWRLYSGG
jgi:hypothetical protein